MNQDIIPSFTADELTVGTPISSVEELLEYGEGSYVALIRDTNGWLRTDLYENVGTESWLHRDPEGDGSEWRSYTAADMLTIATLRDRRQIIGLVKNGDYTEHRRLSTADDLAATGHGAATIRVADDGRADDPFRNYGGWMYAPDNEYLYSHENLAAIAGQGGSLALIWDPPKSKTALWPRMSAPVE